MTELETPQGGVDAPAGTGGEEVPAEPVAEGQPAEPAVPTEQPTAPAEEPTTAERPVNLDDYPQFRQWKSESDRRFAEMDKAIQEAQQRADYYQSQVETADMTDQEKAVYERDRAIRQRDEMYGWYEQQEQQRQTLEYWRNRIATQQNVPLEALSTAGGYDGMLQQAFEYVRRQGTPSPAPRRTPTPAPAAPSHGTGAGSPGLWEQYQAATPSEKRDMRKKYGQRLWEEAGSITK